MTVESDLNVILGAAATWLSEQFPEGVKVLVMAYNPENEGTAVMSNCGSYDEPIQRLADFQKRAAGGVN